MTCDKSSFPSEAVARRAARRTPGNTGERWRAYLCPECHTFHLTTAMKTPDELGFRRKPSLHPQGRPPKARTQEDLEALAKQLRSRVEGLPDPGEPDAD